jgi:hypothetical protein
VDDVTLRTAVVGDEPFLWRMLLVAAHAGNGIDGVEALKGTPEPARYVDGWGRPSDLGVIATERRFAAVSLSARDDNPVRRLYERCGFRPVDGGGRENRVGGTSITMVRLFVAG